MHNFRCDQRGGGNVFYFGLVLAQLKFVWRSWVFEDRCNHAGEHYPKEIGAAIHLPNHHKENGTGERTANSYLSDCCVKEPQNCFFFAV